MQNLHIKQNFRIFRVFSGYKTTLQKSVFTVHPWLKIVVLVVHPSPSCFSWLETFDTLYLHYFEPNGQPDSGRTPESLHLRPEPVSRCAAMPAQFK